MAEATKLKKKLNGSILKGQKIRIEDAQPEKRKRSSEGDDGDADDADNPPKKTRRSKKTKPGDKLLQGYELEDGRKVKRGWTETPVEKRQEKEAKKKSKDKPEKISKKEKKKDKREGSKYTNDPECLFRTSLPEGTESSDKTPEKKSKKNKKGEHRETIVHEFSNTKKHASFLKSAAVSSGENATREYVDGKGWVDAQGVVLEAETHAQKVKRERKEQRRAEKPANAALEVQDSKSAQIGDAVAPRRKSRRQATSTEEQPIPRKESTPSDSEASSSNPSSPEPSSDEESSASEPEEDADAAADTPRAVHPLEALYKRPELSILDTTPKTPKENTFSFFGGGDDSDIEQDEPTNPITEPQTPFTEQDMEWRGTRSAAPTPDTAAIGKRFSFSVMADISEDEDEADEQEGDDSAGGVADAVNGLGIGADIDTGPSEQRKARQTDEEKEESEFAKWFFDNRSENNKKWRTRRREAMKMKRKRENRRLTRRIV